MTLPNIDELIEKLDKMQARATPLPWSWEQCGDKCDAPVVGVSWRDDDETCHPVAGRIQDFDEQGNKVSYYRETIASEWASGGDGSPSANAAFVVEAVNSLPTLIAALTSLQEMNAQQTKIADDLGEAASRWRARAGDLQEEIEALQERNSKLEEALKPFAAVGSLLERGYGPAGWKDDMVFKSGASWLVDGEPEFLRYRDFRRARALLSGGGE